MRAGSTSASAGSAACRTASHGSTRARESTGQDTINALLVKHASEGKRVVRLKGGDPSIFGRLEEELAALARAGVECEVVPGVTAASAAAASTRRPLTRRGSGRSVSLTTAMTHDSGLVATRSADTEVFYMAGKQLGALARRLVGAGWPADTPDQRRLARRLARRAAQRSHRRHARPGDGAACRPADAGDGRRRRGRAACDARHPRRRGDLDHLMIAAGGARACPSPLRRRSRATDR